MSEKQTIDSDSYRAACRILEGVRRAVSPHYLGLVSSDGHPVSSLSEPGFEASDAMASLAAGAYAATRQLACLVGETRFTMMLHEGERLNVHIVQVSPNMLLVVCFGKAAELGKVRLLTCRAARSLSRVFTDDKGGSGASPPRARPAAGTVPRNREG